MKRPMPWNEQVDIISSDSSSEDAVKEVKNEPEEVQSGKNKAIFQPPNEVGSEEGVLLRRAEIYQDYMSSIKIPERRGSLIPCNSWMGLGNSMKQLYGQPLHYLTNIRLKELDQLRIGSQDEYLPLDAIMHPLKAEASIWLTEEIHRNSASPSHLAKHWTSDPFYFTYVDSIFPQL